jgi:uncharacterized protein
MKIHVNRIPAEGLREDAVYDPAALDLDRADLRVEQPITLSAAITKAEQTLLVQAEVQGVLDVTCARCLESFEAPLQARSMLSYEVRPNEIVDITEDIRQEIILAYPMIPVCRPGCKGLCPACGQNLNEAACPHATTGV